MSSTRWLRNDETGNVCKASRSAYLDLTEVTRRANNATAYNQFISQPHVQLTKTGRIKDQADQVHALRFN